jgi:uncharacterized peroxidase-related enzyme
MPLVRSLPQNATLADLRGKYADLLEVFRPYGERLMRGPSPFTPGERELIAAYVSGVNSCRYCFGVHSRVAAGFGVDPKVFAGLMDDLQGATIDERMKPVLRYVRKLTETPTRMTPQDAAAVYDAGWDDTALVHAIAVCAYFNMMNRLVDGAGIVGDAESDGRAARRLIERGYRSTGAGTKSPNQIDQAPSATSSSPVQTGKRRESAASQSSARRARAKRTATRSGSDRASPKSASARKP